MFEDTTFIDMEILSLYIPNYAQTYSIREISSKLDRNYPHSFKRIKSLVKRGILLEKKRSIVMSSVLIQKTLLL